jgi:hypothetical protein
MSWNLYKNTDLRAATKRFRVELIHTNNISGTGIFERGTELPIWTEWDIKNTEKPNQESFYFQGKDVFDITLKSNRPPVFSVYFRGAGKSVTWWLNAGGAEFFSERIYYDTNGDFSREEIWYENSWHPVDRLNAHNGIVINGQWHQLTFDTNGMWTIEAP